MSVYDSHNACRTTVHIPWMKTTGTEDTDNISVTERSHPTCPLAALVLHLESHLNIPFHASFFSFETRILHWWCHGIASRGGSSGLGCYARTLEVTRSSTIGQFCPCSSPQPLILQLLSLAYNPSCTISTLMLHLAYNPHSCSLDVLCTSLL
ncbi:uncharacterized protein BJ212DRAFT_1357448 [Suillus subaureus]|uniref:Uncharacterized protein n=1 Tax=Suillus subaureus TaxID=48587 RepID=A0A9P7EAE4_9AGAM|nr:uncharacterized protein BJ212DRAFT_1357448 [Suillus subaureus]KAG1815601.1 hypothetical protein BJ212DRAFT_1357448 [Suillus subaureus]